MRLHPGATLIEREIEEIVAIAEEQIEGNEANGGCAAGGAGGEEVALGRRDAAEAGLEVVEGETAAFGVGDDFTVEDEVAGDLERCC